MFCFLLLLLCPFVVFLSLFFTNYELLILTMIAVLFYGIYLSLPVWRNFFLLSFYALEDILLFCFHFICFAFILAISYGFLYVCFFQPHVLILRFSWALISMLIFYLFFSIITFVKTKAFGLVFDKRDLFFNLLSRYFFFLFLSSINYFIYMFLPNKYFILFIFLQLFFISNILNFFSNTWKPVINNSSFFNLIFRFFNIAPLLIISDAVVPGGGYFVFQGFFALLSVSSPRVTSTLWQITPRAFWPITPRALLLPTTNARAFSITPSAFWDKRELFSEIIPVNNIVKASLVKDLYDYNSFMRKYNVPVLLGIDSEWANPQEFVHIVHVMQDNLSNDSLVINQVNKLVPRENLLVAPNFDAAFLDKMQLMMKSYNIILGKPSNDGVWTYYIGRKQYKLDPEQSAVLDYVYSKNKHLFVPINQFGVEGLFRFNLGDLYVYDTANNSIKDQVEFKSSYTRKSLDDNLTIVSKKYEGLAFQVLDVNEKVMYSKSANADDFIAAKIKNFDDVAISKKMITNYPLLREHNELKDPLIIKSLSDFRLSNNFIKHKLEE